MVDRPVSSFDRWYDAFAGNLRTRQRYEITLSDGVRMHGVPTASSLIDIAAPMFVFTPDDQMTVTVPFRMLVDAKPLDGSAGPV